MGNLTGSIPTIRCTEDWEELVRKNRWSTYALDILSASLFIAEKSDLSLREFPSLTDDQWTIAKGISKQLRLILAKVPRPMKDGTL